MSIIRDAILQIEAEKRAASAVEASDLERSRDMILKLVESIYEQFGTAGLVRVDSLSSDGFVLRQAATSHIYVEVQTAAKGGILIDDGGQESFAYKLEFDLKQSACRIARILSNARAI